MISFYLYEPSKLRYDQGQGYCIPINFFQYIKFRFFTKEDTQWKWNK